MHQLSAAFNHPERQYPSVHVAGTNGKGSVVTKIARAHEALGLKVGLYTSPHISSFRERISINGRMISEAAIERLLPQIFSVSMPEGCIPTFFEVTTLLAFLYFAEENVDIAVIETGLGGRLDATNIITPLVSVITSISIEHAEFLGSTLEEITREKGGIIKPKVPVVLGPRVPKEPIETIATPMQSPITLVEGSFTNYHEENCAIARRALEILNIPPKAINAGLKALPPCRMETVVTPAGPVILDAAHNPDGLEHLFMALPPQKYRIIVGLSKSKDIHGCVSILKERAAWVDIVCSTNGRGLETELLQKAFIDQGFPASKLKKHSSVAAAVKQALDEGPYPLLICGTFFIMAEARAALGLQEPRDPFDLNEKQRC